MGRRSFALKAHENTDNISCLRAVKSTCVHNVQWLQCSTLYKCTASLIIRVGINNTVLYTNVVFEQDIDLHMCHMSTSWSGDLTSCQSNSDLRSSNMLYANQIKIIINKTK